MDLHVLARNQPMPHPRITLLWQSARHLSLAAIALCSLLHAAEPAKPSAEPTAITPNFADKTLWPADVEKTAYFKEKWKPARVLVFANTGDLQKGDWRDMRTKDLNVASVWTENGKPATTPPDENTDVIFPSSKNRYLTGTSEESSLTARHVTVGSNAFVNTWNLKITGNVWIKGGGYLFGQGFTISGNQNTFMRDDGNGDCGMFITNKSDFAKGPKASVEMLGHWGQDDEMRVRSGTLILGPDVVYRPGDRGGHRLYPGATMVLMSGARLESFGNKYEDRDWVVGGSLQAGTKERPLTKDATLGLSFKVHGELNLPGSNGDDTGLALNPGGTISVVSASPKTARLVFCWSGRAHRFGGIPEGLDTYAHKEKIKLTLLGKTDFDGVLFRDFRLGGIALADPAASKAWKNVTYGDKNEGPADKLLVKHSGVSEYSMDR